MYAGAQTRLTITCVASIFLFAPTLKAADNSCSGQRSPADLVKAVIDNEVNPQSNGGVRWKYLDEKQSDSVQETREVVETNSGTLERLIALAGKPLSSAQQHDEAERILKLANSREQQQKLEASRRKDAEQSNAFLKMMPNAFLFSCGRQSGTLTKILFKPNPQFSTSSREGRVLKELQGEMWIDAKQLRMASINGQLMNEVKFGGGLLGHLEKGGQFSVKREEIAPGDWELTDLCVSMQGKALLFKAINVRQKERRSKFERVPENLTMIQAAGLLLEHASRPSLLAQNH